MSLEERREDKKEMLRDLEQKIAELSKEEKDKVLWNVIVEDQYDRITTWALWTLDFLEKEGLVNNYETGTSDRKPALGMLKALAKLTSQSAATMARQELQVLSEETQFGSEIAQKISDATAEMDLIAEEIASYHCQYEAILSGRRRNIHYVDDEGSSKPYTDRDYAIKPPKRRDSLEK